MKTTAHPLMFRLLFLLSTVWKAKDTSLLGDKLFWLVQRAVLMGVIHYMPSRRAGREFFKPLSKMHNSVFDKHHWSSSLVPYARDWVVVAGEEHVKIAFFSQCFGDFYKLLFVMLELKFSDPLRHATVLIQNSKQQYFITIFKSHDLFLNFKLSACVYWN